MNSGAHSPITLSEIIAMKRVFRVALVGFLMFSASVWAEGADETLKLDSNPFKNSEVFCENEDNVKPSENDFELVDYHTMSSEGGERQVIVTVRNKSTGGRTLKNSHFVAILGNCEYIKPVKFERKFMVKEVLTLTLEFGHSKYPILKVIN